MKNRRWIDVAKWVWIVLVSGGVIYYLSKNHQVLLEHLGKVSIAYLLLSMVLLVIGKLLLTRLSLQSILGQAWQPGFAKMFYINSMMQLAKYLPGGVWHFVGRFGLYRANGISNVQAGKSIVVENAWLVASAVFFGLGMIVFSRADLLFSLLGIAYQPWVQAALVLIIPAVWVFTLLLLDRMIFRRNRQTFAGLMTLMATQFLAWLFIASSFWLVLLPLRADPPFAGLAMGAFALSWAAGYLAVFAPSGLGVREVALTLILGGIINTDASMIYATFNRFVWVIVEVGLGIFCELVYGRGDLSNWLRSQAAKEKNIPG